MCCAGAPSLTIGRSAPTPPAIGYVVEADGPASSAARDTYALFAMPPKVDEPRWNVWAAGFGGSQATAGNVVAGSSKHDVQHRRDCRRSGLSIPPATVAGVSMVGGGSNFSVANGGTDHSDLAGRRLRPSELRHSLSSGCRPLWLAERYNRSAGDGRCHRAAARRLRRPPLFPVALKAGTAGWRRTSAASASRPRRPQELDLRRLRRRRAPSTH